LKNIYFLITLTFLFVYSFLFAQVLVTNANSFDFLDEGLVAYYKFDSGAGDVAYDSSGNGNDGKIVGATWTTGKIGNALSFNGKNNYVVIPDSPSLRVQSFTLEAWIYMTERPNQHGTEHSAIINKLHYLGGRSKGYKLQFEHPTSTNDHLTVSLGDGVAQRFLVNYNSKDNLTLYQWHHVAATYDGSVAKLYIDGELVSTSSLEKYTIAHDDTPLVIGSEYFASSIVQFKGIIDEVRVYNRALSKGEINASMNTKPFVNIDKAFVSDDRADVGSVQTIGFHAKWDNGSDVVGGKIYVNETMYITNGSGWITLNYSSSSVGKRSWSVTGVNVNGVTSYRQTVSNPTIIWDRVRVTLSAKATRVNVGSNALVMHHAIYEYDGTVFFGLIVLNDTFFVQDTVGSRGYKVTSIVDNKYGLTTFSTNEISVIWDRVNIRLNVTNPRISVGSTVPITRRGVYEYDGATFHGSIRYNDTLNKNTVGKYGFTVTSISDPLYQLTVFTTNEVYCIFDRIKVETKVETMTPGIVQVTLNLNFEYDGLPVEDAIVKVNDIVAEYMGNGEYRATLLSWMPSAAINIYVWKSGFGPITRNISAYALGNITLEVSPLIIVSMFVVVRKLRKRKRLMKLKQLEKLLLKKRRLNLKEASEAVGVDVVGVKKLLSDLMWKNLNLHGFFIKNDEEFVLKPVLVNILNNMGKFRFEELSSELGTPTDKAREIVGDLHEEGKLKGTFTLDGKGFVTENWLIEEIRKGLE